MKARLARAVSSRAFLVVAAVLAVLLLLPALPVGFMMDDYAQWFWMRGGTDAAGGPRGFWDLFRFQGPERESLLVAMDRGYWPWWTNPELRLAFFRPLTAITHAIDHALFPNSPALMRLESALMYAVGVVIVGLLYRRLLGATVAAGLAVLMYAIDDAHAVTVVWISNRNAVLAAALGFGALLLHDQAIRRSDRRARIAAPIVFALAMLAAEAALATLAYLVAYALWLHADRWGKRIAALAPYLAITAVWAVAYKLLGYGAWGAEFYIDPVREPAHFLTALATRLPVLLEGQFSFPPSDVWLLVPPEHKTAGVAVVAVLVLLGSAVLAFGVRRTRENGFFATGMLLALVPVCATWPGDRLLIFAGFGAFGLVGDFLTAPRELLTHGRRVVVKAAAVFYILLHIVVAPVFFAGRGVQIAHMLHDPIERAAASYPPSSELAGKTLMIVNGPDFLIPSFGMMVRFRRGEPMPEHMRQLAICVQGRILFKRTGERTVEMLLEKGFFHDPFSLVFRKEDPPMPLGHKVQLTGMTATVKAYTSDRKRVATVEFELDRPADDANLVWVIWKDKQMERFTLPAVGEEVELPPVDYALAIGG